METIEAVSVFTLRQAQALNRCRVCGGDASRDLPLILNYGKEFAHEKCLQKVQPAPVCEDEAVDHLSSRIWAYRITDPPCKHGGRNCPKSECVDCIMEIVEAIQREAYRAGVRAGHSKPIDGFHRDKCECEECVSARHCPACSNPMAYEEWATAKDGICAECAPPNSPDPDGCDDAPHTIFEKFDAAIAEPQPLAPETYKAERERLTDDLDLAAADGDYPQAMTVRKKLDALDSRWRAQEKPPPASDELRIAWKCRQCGAIANDIAGKALARGRQLAIEEMLSELMAMPPLKMENGCIMPNFCAIRNAIHAKLKGGRDAG